MRWDGVVLDEKDWDGTKRDKFACDKIECDEMEWDKMGRDEMGSVFLEEV